MNLDTLELQIVDNAAAASSHLDSLAASLNSVKASTSNNAGLGKITKYLDGMVLSLEKFKTVSIPTEEIKAATSALQPLTTIGKSGFNSLITGLSKVGEVSKTLETVDMNKFATQIQRVATAMRPLADEAAKVYVSLKWLPSVVNKVIGANGKLSTSNLSAAKSYNAFGINISSVTAKFGIMVLVARRMGDMIGGWIEKANMYVENLNLFNVSMGKYAQEALNYAQQINKSMGVDMSEWIRNQGIIMDMSKSFGVAENSAYKMSKALTQLAYDYSSLYNIKVADSMLKIQSALAGEIEPVRRLGKDISVAKLQMVLFNLGIDANVEKLSQSNKAMLRTIALLQQSGSAMGDFAKTLDSPANQLRILNARIAEFSRAMGNLFMPMISAALPYIIAFVQVITEAVNALARMAGFELPKFDYSGIENAGTSIGGITNGLEDATAEAKKLKGMLAGFDELQIIQQKDSGKDMGGLDISGSLIPELDRLTKEYDEKFAKAIKQKTDEIVKSIKENFEQIKKNLELFMPLIKGIGSALGAAFAFKWLGKALTGFKKLGAATGILIALKKAAATAFAVFTISGGKFAGGIKAIAAGLSSLWVSFKTFMQGLSPLAKFAVTLVGLVATFTTVYDSVKKLTLGSLSFGDAMKNIIPVVGLVGTALYAMLGPWGLVLTGVTAVVAAIKAYSDAQDELRQKLVEETFFDGQGIAIGDLADQYSRAAESIASTYDPIIQMKDTLDSARSSVDGATESLSGIVFGIENGLYSAEEKLPQIKSEFEKFKTDMQTILDGTYEVIVYALSGSVGDAYESLGGNLDNVISAVTQTDKEMREVLEQSYAVIDSLNQQLDSKLISQQNWAKGIRDEFGKINSLKLTDVQNSISDLSVELGQFTDIDWGSADLADVEKAFSSVANAADASKSKITESYKEIQRSIEQYAQNASPENKIIFENLSKSLDIALKDDLAKVDTLVSQFLGQMQGNIISEVQSQYDKAMQNWDSLGWFTQTFKYGGNQAAYVESALKDYKSNIVVPMTDKIKEAFGSALSEDDIWAEKSIETMMGQLFTTIQTVSASGNYTTSSTAFAGNVKTSIDTALQNAGFDASGKYVVDGFSKGITDNAATANEAIKSLIGTASGGQQNNGVIGEAERLLNEHSPSKVFENIGLNLDAGFGKGISENTELVTTPLHSLLNSMLSSIKSFVNDAISEFDELIDNLKDTMREISSLESSKISFGQSSYSFSRNPQSDFSRSAFTLPVKNGIPEMVGAIGTRAAVANNDQIVSGIVGGVSKANEPVVAAIHAMANAMVNAYVNNQPIVAIGEKEIARVAQAGMNRLGGLAIAP